MTSLIIQCENIIIQECFSGLDDVCKEGPSAWRCKSLGDCPSLKEMRQKGQRPDVCSFQGPEPIICCPPSTQLETQTATTRPTTQQTRPTTSKAPYWWTTNRISEEEGPVWGSWTTKPTGNRPTTKNPSSQTKSKAEESKYQCSWFVKILFSIKTSRSYLDYFLNCEYSQYRNQSFLLLIIYLLIT